MPESSVRVVDVYPYRLLPDGASPEASGDRASGAEFLVLRRSPGHAYAGAWRMVGGKIEPGETAWAAALRELREETALEVLQFWALPSVNVFYEWQRDTVSLTPAFAAEVRGEPVLDDEHIEALWLPPEAAAERLAWPEQRRLLRLAATLVASGEIALELIIDTRTP
ncbi:MAG: NUDIX domain-containing protein [Bacteroidota bacterium]